MSNVLARFRSVPDGKFLRDAHELERYTREQVKRENVIPKRERLGIGADLTKSARKINRTVRLANGIYLQKSDPHLANKMQKRIELEDEAILEMQDFLEMLRLLDDERGHRVKDPPLEQWVEKLLATWNSVKDWRESEKERLKEYLIARQTAEKKLEDKTKQQT